MMDETSRGSGLMVAHVAGLNCFVAHVAEAEVEVQPATLSSRFYMDELC